MRPAALLAVMLTFLLVLSPVVGQEPGRSFETALEVDLSGGEAEVRGSLTGAFDDNHYYRLVGVGSGQTIRVEGEIIGVETGRGTVALYSPDKARLAGVDPVVGKGVRKKVEISFTPAYEPEHPELTLYLRIGKSMGAFNYSLRITVEPRYDAGSGRDAGTQAPHSVEAPIAKPGEPASFTGFLTQRGEGNDYQDLYKLRAELAPGQALRVTVDPEPGLMVSAILYSEDMFRLRHNQSEARGQPLTMTITGDWKPGINTFYLDVENLGGNGGTGGYTVRVEVLEPVQEATTTAQPPPAPMQEDLLRLVLIVVAVALVAVAVAVLIIRRRRGIRVLEEGGEWWGTGEWGAEEW